LDGSLTLAAPLSVVYEITNRCNLNCFFCYNKINRIQEELSTEEALRLIEELGTLGVFSIDFSGGEPLLRHDLFYLGKTANKNFGKVHLLTNGILINETNVGKVKEIFDAVQVSLDGSKRFHERIRGANTFGKTIKGIRLLVREGCYTMIAFTLNKINLPDVDNFIKLAYSLGVDEIRIGLMRPFNSVTKKYSLSLREVIEARLRIDGISKLFKDKIIRALFPYFYIQRQDRQRWRNLESSKVTLASCGAGIAKCNILPDGSITPCVFFREIAGNCREMAFKEIWEKSKVLQKYRRMFDFKNLIRHIKEKYGMNCAQCKYLKMCLLGCRALAYEKYGDPCGPNPYCLKEVFSRK